MIQFTCPDCGNDTWSAHGGTQMMIDELRCSDCGHTITPT
jgi:predicted RNA-binding Zn-ribbon protein involved in translation (DUF1610 family)